MQNYKYGAPNHHEEFPYLYSNKWTPETLPEILLERLPLAYDMALVDQTEIEILAAVVNIGIDSHLEAATRAVEPHRTIDRKYGIAFDREGMKCLIRRLMDFNPAQHPELKGDPDMLYETAYQLLSAILETLQIEYSGC